jgi:hypothetical protein
MNLVLQLDPETEARLNEHAAREGKKPEAIALEALQERLSLEEAPEALPSQEARLAAFRAFLELRRDDNPNADASRESIYE